MSAAIENAATTHDPTADSAAEPRWRYERFGAIIALDEPPALAHVDQELAAELGIPPSPLWSQPQRDVLEAPVEAHLTRSEERRVGKECRL